MGEGASRASIIDPATETAYRQESGTGTLV
jgi:hypothetical protein